MISILFSILIVLTAMLLFSSHPLSFGLILLLQTISISMITGMMMSTFWYSYILFMVMIGGMLVLFLYMTSVASNMKFKFSWKTTLMSSFLFFSTLLLMEMNEHILNLIYTKISSVEMTISKFFNFPSSNIMILLIIYLLITLIAVVNITKTNYGALRQK